MRFAALLVTLTSMLLGSAGGAVAAVDRVPRMERVAACSWDSPGHNPFMGDVVAAIDRYNDIPTPVRMRLKQRMQARQYDDLVDIRRDQISGRHRYEPTIRDMHFGLDRVCRQVTRQRWTAQMHERGLVYCEQGHCILVPTVCRNVSRIDRRPTQVAGATAGETPFEAPNAAAPPADASVAGSQGVLAEPATRGPQATSSFAEAVAGAAVRLWPIGDAIDPPGAGIPTLGDAGPSLVTAPWLGNAGGGLPPYAGTAIGARSSRAGDSGWATDDVPLGGSHGGSLGGALRGEGTGSDAGPSLVTAPWLGNGGGGLLPYVGTAIGARSSSAGDSGSATDDVPLGGSHGGSLGGALLGEGTGSGGGVLPISAVPEPATWASLLAGLLALAGVSARRKARR